MAVWLASDLDQMSEYVRKLSICTSPWICPIGVLTAETMYTGVIDGGAMFIGRD